MSARPRVLFLSIGWPCGVHEIASNINRLGLADAEIHQIDEDDLRDSTAHRLRDFRPDIVGLRVEGGRFETVCRLIEKIRKMIDTKIILGGPTATLHSAEVFGQSGADYVFAGDAEYSVAQFVRQFDLLSNENLCSIPGLTWRSSNGKIAINPMKGIDETTLRENQLDWSILYDFTTPLDSIYLTGGRGCPGRCSFCSRLHGQTLRTKSARQIIEEIQGADRLVREGKLRLTFWPLYKETDRIDLQALSVSWCSIFDEDFFLDRKRAVEFLQQFEFFGLQKSYRLGFQTNPRSLLDANNRPDKELFYWISRTKAMIQLGAESFHPTLLRRWKKRHTTEQLATVLDALDRCGQDYNIFHILTDYDSTIDEVREATALLLKAAKKHPKMRIASTAFMIPLYGTEMQRNLERSGRIKLEHFTDYERAHPEWMLPPVVRLAEEIDEALQNALYPEKREQALKTVQDILNF